MAKHSGDDATFAGRAAHADDLLPSKGGVCERCGKFVAALPKATEKHDEQAVAFIQDGRTVSAIKFLREQTGCDLTAAKEMVEHMYGLILRPLGPPCVSCGAPLRTPRAKLCAECGARVDHEP